MKRRPLWGNTLPLRSKTVCTRVLQQPIFFAAWYDVTIGRTWVGPQRCRNDPMQFTTCAQSRKTDRYIIYSRGFRRITTSLGSWVKCTHKRSLEVVLLWDLTQQIFDVLSKHELMEQIALTMYNGTILIHNTGNGGVVGSNQGQEITMG